MKTFSFLWAAVLLAPLVSVSAEEVAEDVPTPPPALSIAYPYPNARLPGITNLCCLGAVDGTNGLLMVNGAAVPIHRTGAFLTMVPVTAGSNTITAVWGTNVLVRSVVVAPSEIVKPSGSRPDRIVHPMPPRDPYKDLGIPTNAVFAVSPPRGKRISDILVMVDPGHGGDDPGAFSPHMLPEKDVNLMQARAIRDELKRAGFKVVMTRDDDVTMPLYDRPKSAWRLKADAFISVHHNATAPQTDPRQRRHTTSYGSNARGMPLARAIQKHLGRTLAPIPDMGAQLKSLAVCRNPAVASCLLEVDFINLPDGEEASWEPTRHTRVAKAVVMGVLDWLMEK